MIYNIESTFNKLSNKSVKHHDRQNSKNIYNDFTASRKTTMEVIYFKTSSELRLIQKKNNLEMLDRVLALQSFIDVIPYDDVIKELDRIDHFIHSY
jgi:hypothetical protein